MSSGRGCVTTTASIGGFILVLALVTGLDKNPIRVRCTGTTPEKVDSHRPLPLVLQLEGDAGDATMVGLIDSIRLCHIDPLLDISRS